MIAPLLERAEPFAAEVLAYQWGWRDADGGTVTGAGRGKGVRAALVFASARAAGSGEGPGAEGNFLVPAGVAAVEMLHALSLLHDDVMDGDETRRGRPAAWRVFGPDAVEATVRSLTPHALELVFPATPGPTEGREDRPGDLRELRASARAAGLLSEALVRLAQGQALDLALEEESCPDVAATLHVHADKTGSLFACALGAAPDAAGDLASFGEHLGTAFQIVDDVLGVWGEPAVTGKPVGADLTARKKSHPVAVALTAAAMRAAPAVTHRLRELYALPGPWTPARAGEVCASSWTAVAPGPFRRRRQPVNGWRSMPSPGSTISTLTAAGPSPARSP